MTTVTSNEAKEKRNGKAKMKVPRTVSKDLQNWILDQGIIAERDGMDTTDKTYLFDEINASETARVEGRILEPQINYETGEVVDAIFCKHVISIPKNTPIFPFIERGEVTAVRLTGDPNVKAAAYRIAATKLWKANGKYLLGNLKSEEAILVVVSRKQATEMLGSDISLYENPFKPWLAAFGTPTRLLFESGGDEVLRIRLVNDKKTKYGHKYHDGCMYMRVHMQYKKYIKPDPDLSEAENEARTRELQEIKLSHQDRIFGVKDGMYYHPIKCKGYNDRWKYFEWCREEGFNPYETDAIMCLGNIKTKHKFEHGNIIEVPMSLFRVIGLSSRSGKSSIGGQAVCLDFDKVNALFTEKGMEERAKIFKKACCGDAAALETIIMGQEEHSSFEDATIMYIINMLFAIKREDGSWGWPRFETNHNNVGVRLNRYLQDNVMKCRLSAVALYIEVNPKLDDLEQAYFKEHGKHINYVILPNKSKIKKMMVGNPQEPAQFKYLNIGRNPVVWKGNLQGVELLKDDQGRVVLNNSGDTIEISAAFAYEMFADQDGDKCIFAPSNVAHFPVFRTKLEAEKPKEKSESKELSDLELAKLLIYASVAICEAAMDTGVLDYTARQILIEAWLKGKALTPEQERRMGDYREDAISRHKHAGGKGGVDDLGEEETVKDIMIRLFAVDGAIAPAKLAPAEFTVTKRYADVRGSSERMVLVRKINIINETKFHEGYPFNIAFNAMKGTTFSIREDDSEQIRLMFYRGWQKAKAVLQQKKAEYGFDINTVTEKGDYIDDYYRAKANEAIEMEDAEDKQLAFRKLKKVLRNYMENTLKSQFGQYYDKFMMYLTLYVGTISFGTGRSRSGDTYSKSGLSLRVFPEYFLVKAARFVNPENPWASVNIDNPPQSRAEKAIASLMKKYLEAQESELQGDAVEE